MQYQDVPFESLVGKVMRKIVVSRDKDKILFVADDGSIYKMYHDQNCCESVEVDDIAGDLGDLIGRPILLAETAKQENMPFPESPRQPQPYDSFTWTFYKLATFRGAVTIRWWGESNGYYSEDVDFVELNRATTIDQTP